MAEVARLAVVLSIPVVGEFDQRRVASAALALLDQAFVGRRREEDEGEAGFVAVVPPHLPQPKLVAIEVQRIVEIAHAQHGVQKSHGGFSVKVVAKTESGVVRCGLCTCHDGRGASTNACFNKRISIQLKASAACAVYHVSAEVHVDTDHCP